MALIKCPECGNEISEGASSCPQCGHPMKKEKPKKKHGCLITVVSVIIFFGIVGGAISGALGQNKAIQKSISGVSDDSEYITMEEYNQIDTGMSYDEVKEIVGSSGEVSAQSEVSGYKIIIVTWYGNGSAGSNANVTFTNNKVSAKAQVGLK